MENPVAAQLGANIKAVRMSRRLTQEKLAERIGKSIGLIGQVERGEAMPSVDTLIEIIRALEVSPNGLLGNLIPEKQFVDTEVHKLLAGMDLTQRQYVLEVVKNFANYLGTAGQ